MSLAMSYGNSLDGMSSFTGPVSSMNLPAFGEESVAGGGYGTEFTQLTEDSTLQEILMNIQTDPKFEALEGSGWTPPAQLDPWGSAGPDTRSGASMSSIPSPFCTERQLGSLGTGRDTRLADMMIDSPQAGSRPSLFSSSFWQGVPPAPKWIRDPTERMSTAPLPSTGLHGDGSTNSFLQDLKPSATGMGRSPSSSALSNLISFPGRFPDAGIPPLEPRSDCLNPGMDSIINNLGNAQQGGSLPMRRMSDGQLFTRSQALLSQQTQLQNSMLLKSIIEEHMSQRLPPKKPASHSAAERRRRDRINDRFNTLRELVPGCSKSDKASVLAEVIEYVKRLQVQSRLWEDKQITSSTVTPDAMSHEKEVKEITAWRKSNFDSPATTSGATHTREEEANSLEDDISIEADGTSLVIKICCPDRRGLLSGIAAALSELSLSILEADVITANSRAIDTFRVMPEKDFVQSTDIIKRKLLAVAFPGGAPLNLAVVKQEMYFQTQDSIKPGKDEKRRRISSEG